MKSRKQAEAKRDGLSRYTGWVEDMLNGAEPVDLKAIKGYKFGLEEKDRFVRTLQKEFGLYLTCSECNVSPQVVEYHLKQDPVFRRAVDRVHSQHVEQLERSAYGRAISKSDTLAIFMLKAMKPDLYGDPNERAVTVETKVTVNLGQPAKPDSAVIDVDSVNVDKNDTGDS